MPASRVRPHIAASHSSLTPQMVGGPMQTRTETTATSQPYSMNRAKKYGSIVDAKKAALAATTAHVSSSSTSTPEMNDVNAAGEESTSDNSEEDKHTTDKEKETELVGGINTLFASWYNDIEHVEIRHMIIFNSDNTGMLKSLGNVDGVGARILNFRYDLSDDRSSLQIQYLPLSPLVTNPFEIAKYIPNDQVPTETVTLPFKVYEKVGEKTTDTYSFLAPSGKIYEPTLAIEFEKSPWPIDLFSQRVRYYGALRRIRANKTKIVIH